MVRDSVAVLLLDVSTAHNQIRLEGSGQPLIAIVANVINGHIVAAGANRGCTCSGHCWPKCAGFVRRSGHLCCRRN